MARAGDIIESPAIGDRIVFLKTARDTKESVVRRKCQQGGCDASHPSGRLD